MSTPYLLLLSGLARDPTERADAPQGQVSAPAMIA
jgi:hypothetical protein